MLRICLLRSAAIGPLGPGPPLVVLGIGKVAEAYANALATAPFDLGGVAPLPDHIEQGKGRGRLALEGTLSRAPSSPMPRET